MLCRPAAAAIVHAASEGFARIRGNDEKADEEDKDAAPHDLELLRSQSLAIMRRRTPIR